MTENNDNGSSEQNQSVIDYDLIVDKISAKFDNLFNSKNKEVKETKDNIITSVDFQNQEYDQQQAQISEKETIANIAKFVTSFDQFLEKNQNLLPEKVQAIRAFYDKNNADDDARYFGYRSDLINHFFTEKENFDLLTDDQKNDVKKWMNKDARDNDSQKLDIAYKAFQSALNIKEKLTKQKQMINANSVNYGAENGNKSIALMLKEMGKNGLDNSVKLSLANNLKQHITNRG